MISEQSSVSAVKPQRESRRRRRDTGGYPTSEREGRSRLPSALRPSPSRPGSRRALDRFTLQVSREITRRRFLNRAGQLGIGAGLTMGLLGTRFSLPAGATGTCTTHCGPSQYCNYDECNSGNTGYCTQPGGVRRGPWSSGGPGCWNGLDNCWVETWCPPNCSKAPGVYTCCDCCSHHSMGYTTPCAPSTCLGATLYKCICKVKTGNC